MVIINGFEKEHYGVWANAKTEGQLIIKASRHGDYVEFNDCEISCVLEQANIDGSHEHLLEDRYEIVSLAPNEGKNTFDMVLRKFKEDIGLVLKFEDNTLKLYKVSTEGESLDEDGKCDFTKILSV